MWINFDLRVNKTFGEKLGQMAGYVADISWHNRSVVEWKDRLLLKR